MYKKLFLFICLLFCFMTIVNAEDNNQVIVKLGDEELKLDINDTTYCKETMVDTGPGYGESSYICSITNDDKTATLSYVDYDEKSVYLVLNNYNGGFIDIVQDLNDNIKVVIDLHGVNTMYVNNTVESDKFSSRSIIGSGKITIINKKEGTIIIDPEHPDEESSVTVTNTEEEKTKDYTFLIIGISAVVVIAFNVTFAIVIVNKKKKKENNLQ